MQDKLGELRPEAPIGYRSHGKQGKVGRIVVITIALLGLGFGLYLFPIVGTFSLVGGIGNGLQSGSQTSSGEVMSVPELGITDLPTSVATAPGIRTLLGRLRRETCDREGVEPTADALKNLGYPRQAAQLLESFYVRCKGPTELLDAAVETLMTLSDYQKAYQLADVLINEDPGYARYRYLRGRAAEKLDQLNESLLDHIAALNLLGDPRNVAGSVFYEVSRAYARLGRYCEAMTPIQQWVSYDAAHATPQTNTIIQEFAGKGNCGLGYASTGKSFSVPVNGEVIEATVTINGVEGRFIVDTGASFVVISERLASKAGISWNPEDKIEVLTASGRATHILSSIDRVALGPVEARNVTANIAPNSGIFEEADGLLGMSFLARFEVSLSPTKLEIRGVR